jgi:hypothetical protein
MSEGVVEPVELVKPVVNNNTDADVVVSSSNSIEQSPQLIQNQSENVELDESKYDICIPRDKLTKKYDKMTIDELDQKMNASEVKDYTCFIDKGNDKVACLTKYNVKTHNRYTYNEKYVLRELNGPNLKVLKSNDEVYVPKKSKFLSLFGLGGKSKKTKKTKKSKKSKKGGKSRKSKK